MTAYAPFDRDRPFLLPSDLKGWCRRTTSRICVLVGAPSQHITIDSLRIQCSKVLTGSLAGDARPHIDIPRIIRLKKAARLSLHGLITHGFPLAEINPALDLVHGGKAGRMLLQVGGR